MPDRNYHHAPYTLDAVRDLPEDVEAQPLSAGHDEEQRDRVRAADDEHTKAVKDVEKAEAKRDEKRQKADAEGEGPSPSEFERRQRADLTGGKESAEDKRTREQADKQDKKS
jgi:hypothetical protein